MLKKFGIIALLSVTFVNVSYAQRVILDSQINGVGVVSPQGERVYLRIFDNGKYEFEDEFIDDKGLQVVIHEGHISESGLKSLIIFLESSAIRDLPKYFGSNKKSVDHFLELKISIRQEDKLKRIKIINYYPETESNEINFIVLFKLLCQIERIRKGASFELFPDLLMKCQEKKSF